MINGFDDVEKAGRANWHRTLESYSALSRGWQTLADETADYSKKSFEAGTEHLEKLLAAKSLDVAVEAQSEFVRASYEKAMGQAARFGEIYLDLVRDASKPFEGLVPTPTK